METLIDAVVRLIEIRSTADRPDELHRALDFVLDLVGPGFTVRRFASRGKPSALVTASPGVPRVILNAHLDVVPAPPALFEPRRDGDRLHGRGAHDMKAAAVVLATTFRDLSRSLPFPIALQLVTDEEVGGFDGTGHQVERGVRGGFVIIGEQSGLRVVTESKGIIRARLDAAGHPAHAAYPWLGSNALVAVVEAVHRLVARYPVPAGEAWTTTVNVARISTSNEAANIVPADASALLDIRFPPSDADLAGRTAEEVAAFLRSVIAPEEQTAEPGVSAGEPGVPAAGTVASAAGPAVQVTVEALGAPHHAGAASDEVQLLRAAARSAGYDGELLRKHGAADGRFYSAQGIDAVIFGPGGDGQHSPDEYLDIRTLLPYREALTTFLRSLP
jgi:succinyl-diaminopimelate desuccinylase